MSTDNPFTKIESRIDSLNQAVLDMKQIILDKQGPPSKDSGGIEIAIEETGLSSHSIYRLVHQRKIPHCKKGGRLFFSRITIRKWIQDGNRTVQG